MAGLPILAFCFQIVAEIDNELLAEMKRYKNDTAAKDMIDRIQANVSQPSGSNC